MTPDDEIRVDFHMGCRVHLPSSPSAAYHVRVFDLDSGFTYIDQHCHGGTLSTQKKFWIRYGIIVRKNYITVFQHELRLRDKFVLFKFAIGCLGDTVAWFAAVHRFASRHRCRAVCMMDPTISALFRDAYPSIVFIGPEEKDAWAEKAYATYELMLYFGDDERNNSPVDYRATGLHHNASHILGMPFSDKAPRISVPGEGRPIPEPYVCIAVQASSQVKYWNNPRGWDEVVGYLKGRGYRVICIDRNSCWGVEGQFNSTPPGAEDETGERPLTERVNWLRHAAFFVGLSSGLSWLAWAAGCKVVLVSGFTDPMTEFATPYRVINRSVCNSCWNDMRIEWKQDWVWCPRHKDTWREHECTKKISGQQVIAACARASLGQEHGHIPPSLASHVV